MHLNSRRYKLVCSACLLLSTSALVMIARASASGYEVSIYTTNLSPLVWVLLISSMGGSIFLLVSEALVRESGENSRWLIPFFILAFSCLIVLLLPALKGYFIYGREDTLGNLGFIKDIISTGHFADYNIYPALHVFSTALAITTGLSADRLILYLLPVFSLGYILAIYFLAKSVFQKNGQIVLATTLGAIPLLPHVGVLSASNPPALMFPLILALLVRALPGKSLSWTLLFILMLVLSPYLHPLATMVHMITLLVVYLLQAVANRRFRARQPIPFNFLFILVAVSFLWYMNFFIFNVALEWAVRLFTWDAGTSPIPKIITELGKVEVEGFEIVTLAFKMYGGEIICGVLAVIGVAMMVHGFVSRRRETRKFMLTGSLFIVFSSIYLAYYAGLSFGLGEAYSRFALYVPIVSIMSASLALYEVVRRYGYVKLLTLLTVCLVVVSATFSIFNKYPSPYRYQPNSQVTRMEVAGIRWILSNRDMSTKVTYIATSLFRYASGIYGGDFVRRNSIDPSFPYHKPIPIPDHFNYQNYPTLGESFSESGYMMLSEFDRLLYQRAWKRVGRFGQEDFDRLEGDPAADKLYTNGEFDLWFVWLVMSPVMPESQNKRR